MTDRDWDVVYALAANQMNPNKAAKELFMHRNTVVYHIEKIKRITGLDPNDFFDLHDLLRMSEVKRDG